MTTGGTREVICGVCGAATRPEKSFCISCGNELHDVSASASASPLARSPRQNRNCWTSSIPSINGHRIGPNVEPSIDKGSARMSGVMPPSEW